MCSKQGNSKTIFVEGWGRQDWISQGCCSAWECRSWELGQEPSVSVDGHSNRIVFGMWNKLKVKRTTEDVVIVKPNIIKEVFLIV